MWRCTRWLPGSPRQTALVAAVARSQELEGEQVEGQASAELEAGEDEAQETGLEKELGMSTQALEDNWWWDRTWYCEPSSAWTKRTCRNCTTTQNFQIDDIEFSTTAGVINTGERSNLTGNFKVRPWYTWSDPASFDLKPGWYIEWSPTRRTSRRYDVKMFVAGDNRSYSACMAAQVN